MIGLICVCFIGKYFYKLAKAYKQNSLVFVVLGILSFYFGVIVLGNVILYFVIEFSNYNSGFIVSSFFGTGLLTMPFGIGSACLFHYLLEKMWKKSEKLIKDEIQDIGKKPED